MAQEDSFDAWACTLCGTEEGCQPFYNEQADECIYLCGSCLERVGQSVDEWLLYYMTGKQLKRHMEVRDKLAQTYKHSFKATKTFYAGKKRDYPILEVDEKRKLWAIPNVPMPLARSLSSITDIDLALSADELKEDDKETAEMIEELGIKDIFPFVRTIIAMQYTSKHMDLAPIPKGQFVNYLYMRISLDERESGLPFLGIDLLPFLIPWPSHVNAGYDCAYELIEYLKKLAAEDYREQQLAMRGRDLDGNDLLSILVARGQISASEAGVIMYYLERVPMQASEIGTKYSLVKSVVDTVTNHILFNEKVPEWTTQHTVELQAFFGAFHRYAPGISVGDVVYVVDKTKLQSGKGGMLLAQNSFAVDDFTYSLEDESDLEQPIAYDDLLFVRMGKKKGELILAFRDRRHYTVKAGKYAHCLFAIINCIVLLRSK